MKVVKRNGDIEEYDPNKVMRSMRNAGVSESAINEVVKELEKKWRITNYDKISTRKLYDIVFKLVSKKADKYAASIYSLKQAIISLGPSGYAFEDFIARIFRNMGEEVSVRQKYESMCVLHELDVVGKNFFAECKYHNRGGIITGIKEAMYTHARFLDLKHASEHKNYNFEKVWLVTNTKLSDDAISYANYWKINLLSWKYPEKNSLSKIIDEKKLYPVTIVPSITRNDFHKLSENNILLIKELCGKREEKLIRIGIEKERIQKILNDCEKFMEQSFPSSKQ